MLTSWPQWAWTVSKINSCPLNLALPQYFITPAVNWFWNVGLLPWEICVSSVFGTDLQKEYEALWEPILILLHLVRSKNPGSLFTKMNLDFCFLLKFGFFWGGQVGQVSSSSSLWLSWTPCQSRTAAVTLWSPLASALRIIQRTSPGYSLIAVHTHCCAW